MFAPRTPTAEGMLLVLPPGAVPRLNTLVNGLLYVLQVGSRQVLAYACVASWICVQPMTTCPGMVGSCSIGVANSALLESHVAMPAWLVSVGNQLLPPSLVALAVP